MRIKFLPNWCSSEEGTKRLFDQFYIDQDLRDIEFVHDDNFDIIFYCGYERDYSSPTAKKYIFNMEPSWSGNTQRGNTGIDAIIYAQHKEMFSDPTKIIETPLYMFYGSGGENWTIKDTQIDYEKTKNISCVISSLRNTHKIENCLYDDRFNLVENIIKSDARVDVFGRECEHINCAGGLPRKIEALKSYKFSIAVENCAEKNYITEKFYDCVLTNTIPIYFGATNIKKVFPENGYFVIEDLNNINRVIELLNYVNENADMLYEKMLPELLKIKNRFFTEFNLLTKIIEISREHHE
jgi:hypothetical protein